MNYGKNRQWTAVMYNENMRSDWESEIGGLLQLPYAYCVHDKGLVLEKGERRKVHTHIILVFPAPTTYKHAVEVFGRLNAEGRNAFNTIEPVYSARHMYDYLIHDTEDCKKKSKYLFDPAERVTGNNYDIGSYEQVSQTDKNEMFDKLVDMILAYGIENYYDFVVEVKVECSEEWDLARDVMRAWSGFFERLIKGVYLRGIAEMQDKMQDMKAHGGSPEPDPQEVLGRNGEKLAK